MILPKGNTKGEVCSQGDGVKGSEELRWEGCLPPGDGAARDHLLMGFGFYISEAERRDPSVSPFLQEFRF